MCWTAKSLTAVTIGIRTWADGQLELSFGDDPWETCAVLDFRTRIQRYYIGLRPAERRVADHLLHMNGQRLNQSITELAHSIGVSEATVSRLSRALGFTGYADMKLAIAADSNPDNNFRNIPKDIKLTDGIGSNSQKLADVLTRSIFETQRMLDVRLMEASVDALHRARRVIFIGVGGAGAICDEAAHVLLKIGIDAVSYSDGYTQTIVAATLKPDCALVAISHTGTTPTVVSAVRAARRNGVTTIGITGDGTSELGLAAEFVFVTSEQFDKHIPLYGDFLEGRICQLFLIDVLYLGLMFRLNASAQRSLEKTTEALADHFGAQPSKSTSAKVRSIRRRR